MADEDVPLHSDDADARAASEERSAVPEGFFQNLYRPAAEFAADPANADPQTANFPWIPLGPRNVGGRIRCMAQDPVNTATLYAGSAFGGLWKTDNRGDTWRPISFFLPAHPNKEASPPIGAIGICHRTPDTIYVGTGEPVPYKPPGIGLYRSVDSGATFQELAPPSGGTINAVRFDRILVDPWEQHRAFVACPTGLWRSGPAAPPVFAQDMISTAVAVATSQDVTDIAIDFADRTAAAAPATFTVFAGIRDDGVYRAVFDRAANTYRDLNAADHPFRLGSAAAGVKWAKLGGSFPDPINDPGLVGWGGQGRIKLALCERRPRNVYAIFCLKGKKASNVFVSTDSGDSWHKTDDRDGDDGTQANYDLVLDVHPDRPEIFVVGIVDLFLTVNGGDSWTKIIDWLKYNQGDRAQHADQHGFLFDRGDPRAIWASNDGGIAYSTNLGRTWRKRSHGIIAVQFYDVTNHPTYPHIYGGGFQDNGSWVSYGGPTWFYLSGGDGGAMAFQPGEAQFFLTTWQGNSNTKRSLTRIAITSPPEDGELPGIASNLPDVPGTGANGGPPFLKYVANNLSIEDNFQGKHYGIFGGKLQGHPRQPNHWIMARVGAAYVTRAGTTLEGTNGPVFDKLGLPAYADFNPAAVDEVETSAIAYAPSDPDHEWWIGTSKGEVFHTADAGTTWSANLAPAVLNGNWIADINVHAGNSALVALAVANRSRQVYISGDTGATWRNVTGPDPTGAGPPPPQGMFRVAASSVVIDPRGPVGIGAADLQTLYLGSLAGVFVSRNITPDVGGPVPVWRTLNTNLPLALIRDIEYGRYEDPPGTLQRHYLRVATYGRGAYHLELDTGALGAALAAPTTPNVRLLIRSTPIDDGHHYAGVARLANDPRLRNPTTGAQTPLTPEISCDIRVDAPPFTFFDRVLDPVEFDEEVRSDKLVIGESNLIYVHVQNTGFETVNDVFVHLYFANAGGAAHNAPDLDAGFWGTFPAPPAAGATWQKAGQAKVDGLGPAQPSVARIEWAPPITLGDHVALLALATQAPHDDLQAHNTANLHIDPRVHVDAALVTEERRAALRVVEAAVFVPDLYVRDSIDDTGETGAVAWGARASDIVVLAAAEATPDLTFLNLADAREDDRIRGKALGAAADAQNFIYVRVWNRKSVPLSATVRLYYVSVEKMTSTADWVAVQDATGNTELPVNDIPPHGSLFSPEFRLTNPPDPAPGHTYKAALLVAVVSAAGDVAPAIGTITDLESFWRFFVGRDSANNAAFRGLRYVVQA